MRAVLDANVLISAMLSRGGTPARLLAAWRAGHFELVISENLIQELRRALAYPKLRRRIPVEDAEEFVAFLSKEATMALDPPPHPTLRSTDPGDDYLLALAGAESAVLVSGDGHLLTLSSVLPVRSPADFLAQVGA